MADVRVIVLRAPGINCEEETQFAWRLAGAACDVVHLNRLIESPGVLGEYDILTVPGGFSYGDDVSAGRIFATRLELYLADALRGFVDRGRAVLGICNGFQVLAKCGLLSDDGAACTLAFNDNGVYTCRWITARCDVDHCVFLERGRDYFLPMAHAEGRVCVGDDAVLDSRRVGLRYVEGAPRLGPVNPNGSAQDVAGLTDATGLVLGMMPHPERFVHRSHCPIGGEKFDREPDGLSILRAAVRRFQ